MPVRVCLCLCCAYLIFGGLFLQIGISTAVQHFMVPFLCSLCRSRSNSKFDQGLFIAAFTAEDRSKYAFSFLYIWPSLSVSPPLPHCSLGVCICQIPYFVADLSRLFMNHCILGRFFCGNFEKWY